MGHLGNICHDRLTLNIFTSSKSQLGFGIHKLRALDQITEHNRTVFFIWYLDTYSCFTRDRSFDTDIRRGKIQLDIICQPDNLADFYSLFRLQLIPGHRRTTACIGDMNPYSKVLKCLLQL